MPTITEEIIIRSIQNTATPQESAILNHWLKEDKRNMSCYFQLQEIWNSRSKLSDEYIEKSWEMLAQQIDKYPVSKQLSHQIAKRQQISWLGYVAAVFAGILIASTLWLTFNKKSFNFNEPLIQHTVYNKTGVQSIILPDQSQVWLNENSRIDYPEEFSKGKRLVSLEGKAYFDVQKDLEKPFIVQIGEAEIEVVGTEFFVESTSIASSAITLISGKVNLNYKNQEGAVFTTSLVPGEQALLSNGNVTIEQIDTDYYIAWKDGTYRFIDEPLEKIIPILEKHFEIDIQISESLKNKRFTGRVLANQDIESVLLCISKSYPIKYRITETKVKIFK